MIGVLRDGRRRAPSRPQPTLADIPGAGRGVARRRDAGRAAGSTRGADVPAATRPHGLPGRAGGPDERAQARAGRRGRGRRAARGPGGLVVEVVSRRAVGVAARRRAAARRGHRADRARRAGRAGRRRARARAARRRRLSSCARRCLARDPRPARRRRRARALRAADDARRRRRRSRSSGRPRTAAGCSRRSTCTAPTSC